MNRLFLAAYALGMAAGVSAPRRVKGRKCSRGSYCASVKDRPQFKRRKRRTA